MKQESLRKKINQLVLGLNQLVAVFAFLYTGPVVAFSEYPFYAVPGYTILEEENDDVESYIRTTVEVNADPAIFPSGRATFSGVQIPVSAADIEYDDMDGGAILLGWRYTEQFVLELSLVDSRELEVFFNVPRQTVGLVDLISDDGLGGNAPGNVTVPAVVGRVAKLGLLQISIGTYYQFNVHDNYRLYLGGGLMAFIEDDVDLNPDSGLNADIIKTHFDSDTGFYLQAGFDIPITDRCSLVFDIKQVSSDSLLRFENIMLATDNPDTESSGSDLETKFDISGNLYHIGLRIRF